MLDWLQDLLLESPVPPSNWLPSRAQRLADARITLRRRFGLAGGTSGRRPHYLRDMGSAYPLFGASRSVSGERVEAELESDITTVNPPIMQGWCVGLTIIALWFVLVGLASINAPGTGSTGPLYIGWAIATWAAVVGVVGWLQRVIELDDDGVHVRRWTDVWLRRTGLVLGPPSSLVARLATPSSLVIDGPTGACRLSLWLWPNSARSDLVDELPLWGVDCTFDRHRRRPTRGRRRRR